MLEEGIYVKQNKATLGTGHTTRTNVVRQFYAVCQSGRPGEVELYFLDENDKFRPTGISETCGEVECAGMLRVTKLDEFFLKLKPHLARFKPAARTVPLTAPAAPQPTPAPAAAAQPAAAKEPAQDGDSPWWEMTSKGSGALGGFKSKKLW